MLSDLNEWGNQNSSWTYTELRNDLAGLQIKIIWIFNKEMSLDFKSNGFNRPLFC